MFAEALFIVAKHWNTVEQLSYSRDYYIAMRMNKYNHIITWIILMSIRFSERKPDVNKYILYYSICAKFKDRPNYALLLKVIRVCSQGFSDWEKA